MADSVTIRIYDISGSLVHEAVVSGDPSVIDDGQGPQYAYEYLWNVSESGSGVYVYVVTARKGPQTLKRTGKCAVIK